MLTVLASGFGVDLLEVERKCIEFVAISCSSRCRGGMNLSE